MGSTRVTLDTVIRAYHEGYGAEEIAEGYSALLLADVYGTIAYYLQHQADVDAYLAQRTSQGETLRQKVEARSDQRGLRERLVKRRRTVG